VNTSVPPSAVCTSKRTNIWELKSQSLTKNGLLTLHRGGDIRRLPPEFTSAERLDGVFFIDLPSAARRSQPVKDGCVGLDLPHPKSSGKTRIRQDFTSESDTVLRLLN
jgi:hypothetical protein